MSKPCTLTLNTAFRNKLIEAELTDSDKFGNYCAYDCTNKGGVRGTCFYLKTSVGTFKCLPSVLFILVSVNNK